VALLAAIYTSFGGLRSVAVTDALQAIVMGIAALCLHALDSLNKKHVRVSLTTLRT